MAKLPKEKKLKSVRKVPLSPQPLIQDYDTAKSRT